MGASRDKIVRGFRWAVKEGLLCEEPVRGCKFKIMNTEFGREITQRRSDQVIPMAQNVVYSSFLTATPRLMKPLMIGIIICPEDCIEHIYNIEATNCIQKLLYG